MKKTSLLSSVLLCAGATALTGCGSNTAIEEHEGYNLVIQKGGQTLGYCPASGVGLLDEGGFKFKDLNRNGKLDVYEDWRKSPQERAKDLAAQLSVEEIAGLMLYSAHQSIPGRPSGGHFQGSTYNGKTLSESGLTSSDLTDQQKKFLAEDNVRAVLVTTVESPEVAARWNNNVQAFVEGMGHGIPANNSSDPRHTSSADAEYNFGAGGKISYWPSELGISATFDPAVMKKFGEVASKEYRALGIATALSPQVDLATDPRWSRFSGTFGDDAQLSTDMARAYCDGFQTSTKDQSIEGAWGHGSVNTMVKHWYGYGAQEGGRDSHFCYGKYAVYPGNNLEEHLMSFVEGAFKLEDGTGMASAIMPIYSILWNQDPSGGNVGGSYSKWMIQEQLREKYHFDGVACTDWNIMFDNNAVENFGGMCWGVENVPEVERHFLILEAGVDQFGGQNDKTPVIGAYNMWVEKYGKQSADERFQKSAYRLLLNIFRVGLFENPYLDPAQTKAIVGCPEFMQVGYETQLKSIVMLKNHENTLPVATKKNVYVAKRHFVPTYSMFGVSGEDKWDYPVNLDMVKKYYNVVDDPAQADFALVFIKEPSSGPGYDVKDREKGGNGYVPVSLQYNDYTATYARATSIAGGDPKETFTNRSYKGKTVKTANKDDMQVVLDTKKLMGEKPVVVVLNTGRPMVVSEFEKAADALLLTFSIGNQAVLDIVSGKVEPSGLLPMDLPVSMKAVEEQMEDVSHDYECYKDADGNIYKFAFGMNWQGVINDARVQKYQKK